MAIILNNDKIIQRMKVHNQSNEKFKKIFDNIDECMIIINQEDNTIEYANQKFFNIFQTEILKVWH